MPHSIPNIVSLGDPEQDGDDQLADIVLCHLHSMGVLNYMGSIANHHPSDKRANFLRTQHFLLGTPEVLVAAGTDGTGGREHRALYYHELQNQTFDDQEWNKNDHIDGHRLLHQILNNTTTSNKVTILNTSSFQDLSEYFKTQDDQTLRERIGKVVSQGGYKIEYGLPQPDLTAMNNKFNPEAATYVTTRLGKLNIPSDAWGKQVATAAALDRDFLKTLPGPLGYHIGWLADRKDYKYYFDALHQPFMPHLGKEWLLEIYMGIPRDSKEFQEILSQPLPFQTFLKAAKYPAYDACAAIGTLDPEILRCLGILEPSTGLGQVQTHRMFGQSREDLGGIDTNRLKEILQVLIKGALISTCKRAEERIPTSSLRYSSPIYNVSLDTFKRQWRYLKMVEDFKRESNPSLEDIEKFIRDNFGDNQLIDNAGNLVRDRHGQVCPMYPTEIPYGLLLEEDMRDSCLLV
jgi:hypothetical protein